MNESSTPVERTPLLPIALLCIGVSTLYVLSMLSVTDSHFVPQVSDLYLIAQYAKGFAEGHPFQYNAGETPTTGATSLLHTLFLAVAHFVGFRGEGLIAFAILSGAVFAFLTAVETYGAGRLISGSPQIALFGAMLVILNGPLAWSFHYGADIALVLFLAAWLFRNWLMDADPEEGPSRAFVLPASLLALTRPEAAVLVAILAAWKVWDWRKRSGKWRARAMWFLPVVLAVLVPLVFRVLTGSAANTSFSQKLLSANWGGFSAAVFSIEYWSDLLRGVLLGFYPASHRLGLGGGNAPYFAAPFLLVFVFIALLRPTREMKRAGAFLTAALATVLLVTPSIHIGVHSNRYVLFTLPPLFVLFAVGVGHTAASLEASLGLQAGSAFRRLRALALVFAALSVARFALVYADSANSVYRKDEAIFTFINSRLPENTSFLSNGAAIEYRTGRRSLNLSGVVTPGFAEILPVETEASAFEILSRPEAPALPPFLIAQEAYVEGSPAWAALIGGPPVFVTASLDGAEFGIYPTRADLIGRQRGLVRLETPPEWSLVDSLNVADPRDERLHEYRFRSTVGTRSLFAALKLDKYEGTGRNAGTELADGGRVILGSEEMRFATPYPGDVWLVLRTNASPSSRVRHAGGESRIDLPMTESALRVSTSRGRTDWMRVALEPGWTEAVYRLPGALVEGSTTRFHVEGRYAAYSYWVYQVKGR